VKLKCGHIYKLGLIMTLPNISKKALNQLIEKQKADTFWSHFMTFISWDYDLQGEEKEGSVIIWKQNSWNRTFYPVHTFRATDRDSLVYVNSKLNRFGRLLLSFMALIPLVILWQIFIQATAFKPAVILAAITMGFFFIVGIVMRKIYRTEKMHQLEDLFLALGHEYPKTREHEWSIGKILLRLFTYPFCIFLVALSLIEAIPNGEYVYGILALVFSLTYLITDLAMMVKKANE
jgi:hypothetical protein